MSVNESDRTYAVAITPQAVENLRDIKKYLSDELFQPQGARRAVNRILTAIESLLSLPGRRRILAKDRQSGLEIRGLTVRPYCVLYTIAKEDVIVIAILSDTANAERRASKIAAGLHDPLGNYPSTSIQ